MTRLEIEVMHNINKSCLENIKHLEMKLCPQKAYHDLTSPREKHLTHLPTYSHMPLSLCMDLGLQNLLISRASVKVYI